MIGDTDGSNQANMRRMLATQAECDDSQRMQNVLTSLFLQCLLHSCFLLCPFHTK